MQVEIVNPLGNVSYRRPHDHPDVLEAFKTTGYSVRGEASSDKKTKLPPWAHEYNPASEQRGDHYASFYEDMEMGTGTITVGIQRCEGDTFCLEIWRGGITESRFTANELARVLELANILKPK